MIKLENIHLQIGNKLLLENESLDIYEGYLHVIMGESGSGKTTLLHEISLLLNLSKAKYVWNDKRIDRLNDDEKSNIRRNNIGYILQDLELISEELSLKDNIDCMFALTGQDYDEDKVNEYMTKLNLNCSLEQRVEQMSRGERQRFALVLALIKDVDLIICDEPTSALDIDNSYELMKHLRSIAKDYNKMIVIATHDSIVADKADILYRIVDKHLIVEKQLNILKSAYNIKEVSYIKSRFYKVYMKSHKKISKLLMKIIYVFMITILCIAPIALSSLLEKQEELYQLFASHEIIVVNTEDTLPYATYDGRYEIFEDDIVDMLKEIEHVESVDYYWEMDGSIAIEDDYIQVLLVPKSDITIPVISSRLSKKLDINFIVNFFLDINMKSYDFKMTITDYDVKDYPQKFGVDKEVIYVPLTMINDSLLIQNINISSSLTVYCDDIENIEETMSEIQRWLPNATISSSSTQYIDQIKMLENLQKYIVVLRVVLVIGIIVIAYIVQTMENKAREREISNLRINGMNRKSFYELYYYENRNLMIMTVISSLIGYIFVIVFLDVEFILLSVVMILLESILYIIITRIVPLSISVRQIFTKDISAILRDY